MTSSNDYSSLPPSPRSPSDYKVEQELGSSPESKCSMGRNLSYLEKGSLLSTALKQIDQHGHKLPVVPGLAESALGAERLSTIAGGARVVGATVKPVATTATLGVDVVNIYNKYIAYREVSSKIEEKQKSRSSKTPPSRSERALEQKASQLKSEVAKSLGRVGIKGARLTTLFAGPVISVAGLSLMLAEEMIDRNKIKGVNKWVVSPVVNSVSRLSTDRTVSSAIHAALESGDGLDISGFHELSQSEIRGIVQSYKDALYAISKGMSEREYEGERRLLKNNIQEVKKRHGTSAGERKERIFALRDQFRAKINSHRVTFGSRVIAREELLAQVEDRANKAFLDARGRGASISEAREIVDQEIGKLKESFTERERLVLDQKESDDYQLALDDISQLDRYVNCQSSNSSVASRKKTRLFNLLLKIKEERLEDVESRIEEKSGYRKTARGAKWCIDTGVSAVAALTRLVVRRGASTEGEAELSDRPTL